jgi:hypothetical protein
MQLLERYLNAVRAHVPEHLRDDVIEELRGEIEAAAAEEEGRRGRALNLDEEDAILKRWGHPWVLAGRYRGKRYLIGPDLYHMYLHVLKISLASALALHLMVIAFLAATRGISGQTLLEKALQLPLIALAVFGSFTLVFAMLDFQCARGKPVIPWKAKDLPVPGTPQVPRRRILHESITTLVALWSVLAIGSQPEWLHLDKLPAVLSTSARMMILPMLITLCVRLLQQAISAMKPGWFGFWALGRISTGVVLAGLAGWLAIIGAVAPRTPGTPAFPGLGHAIRVSLAGLALACAWGIVATYRQWRRAGAERPAHSAPGT